MSLEFVVKGPFSVFSEKKEGGRFINADCGLKFFEKHHEYGQSKGIYVFCLSFAKGTLPVYVGKATKSFSQEVFTPDKLMKYNESIIEYRNEYKPLMYLLIHPLQKGKTNSKAINDLETFLIEVASLRNPNLKNIRKANNVLSWSIKGVYNTIQGKPTTEAQSFRKAMKL